METTETPQALLPAPAATPAKASDYTMAPPAAKGFNPAADLAALKAQPKEDYRSQWTKAAEPEPKKPEPDPAKGPTEEPGETGPVASAKEFLEVYDMLQAFSFSTFSQGMNIEKFRLPKMVKDRAAHHLAKGLQKMGVPELPWYLGLGIALTPSAVVNYQTAAANRLQAAQAAKRNREAAKTGQPLNPTSITRADGTPVAFTRPSSVTSKPRRNTREPLPLCTECNAVRVKQRGRKYCGHKCRAKAQNRERNTAAKP